MKQLNMVAKPSEHRHFMPTLPSGLQALLPLIWSWTLLSLSPLWLILFVPICIGIGCLGLSSLMQGLSIESDTSWRRLWGRFFIAASVGAAIAGAVMKFQPLGILIAESVLTFSLGVHFIAQTYSYFKTPQEERTPMMKSNLITSGIKNLFQLGILAASLSLFLIPGLNFAIGVAVLATAFLYGTGFGSWEEERRHKLISEEFNAQFGKRSDLPKNIVKKATEKNSLNNGFKSFPQQHKSDQIAANPHAFYSKAPNTNSIPLNNPKFLSRNLL